MSDQARFRELLVRLGRDDSGWHGDAGGEFVEFMAGVLEAKAGAVSRSGGCGLDCVSEAVLVVSGVRGSLGESVAALLGMDNPLGYVIKSVVRNLDRAALEEAMGVGSRQVGPGVARVARFSELEREGSWTREVENVGMSAAWAQGVGVGSVESEALGRSFAGVLIQRFGVRAAVVQRSLEVAADVAVAGDTGVGVTTNTTRRRLARFAAAGAELKGVGLRRNQVQAMGWLLFGSERHPEWSLLTECAVAARAVRAVQVSPWQAQHARAVADRGASLRLVRGVGVQPSLFEDARVEVPVGVRRRA